jgi:hypothetical protein
MGVPSASCVAAVDPNKEVTLNGTLLESTGRILMCQLLDVKQEPHHELGRRVGEPDLQRSSWNATHAQPGDMITVQGVSTKMEPNAGIPIPFVAALEQACGPYQVRAPRRDSARPARAGRRHPDWSFAARVWETTAPALVQSAPLQMDARRQVCCSSDIDKVAPSAMGRSLRITALVSKENDKCFCLPLPAFYNHTVQFLDHAT